MAGIPIKSMRTSVSKALAQTPLVDIHTHLFDPAMGSLLLWGIDELLTYHYLVAEVFRARPEMGYQSFFALPKTRQAELIWDELFVKRSPVSEACRGVLTVIQALGLDPNAKSLSAIRRYFAGRTAQGYVDQVFKLAGVSRVYMIPLKKSVGGVISHKAVEIEPNIFEIRQCFCRNIFAVGRLPYTFSENRGFFSGIFI